MSDKFFFLPCRIIAKGRNGSRIGTQKPDYDTQKRGFTRGIGTYDDGVENCRVQVTLATSIPEEECKAINLGYRDPASIEPAEWEGREEEGYLLVPNAGEVLYRVRK